MRGIRVDRELIWRARAKHALGNFLIALLTGEPRGMPPYRKPDQNDTDPTPAFSAPATGWTEPLYGRRR